MKSVLTLMALLTFLGSSCSNEKIGNGFDANFDIVDNESTKLSLIVVSHFSLYTNTELKLEREYGKHYKDSLLIPLVESISRNIVKEYSAGEIYNYKRSEIEQKIIEQTRNAFASHDITLEKLFIGSVELSDELRERLVKEHVERVKK